VLAALTPLFLFATALSPGASTFTGDDVGGASAMASDQAVAPGQRQRHTVGPQKRGIHELKNPADWPAEPATPAGPLDAARFDAAVVALCGEVAPSAALPELARLVREISAETSSDAFLLAALVYRESRCHAGLASGAGVGLLQIQPTMFHSGAALPFARAALERDNLLDPAANLRVGAALLAMWDAQHEALDRATDSTPHRTAVAHFFWGDKVWGATAEDRTLVARRRLLALYGGAPRTLAATALGLDIVAPLDGGTRLGTSGPGADRDDGARAHRGLDIDATVGEPVRAVAGGVVQFAGADLPGQQPARGLLPRQLRRWRGRNLGPGGFFVRVLHDNGLRSGYFHLTSFRVVAGQTVQAGEVIGTVGRTGIKVSGSHLHFEVHRDGELEDPVRFLSAFVLPPERTITHELAMAGKRLRLARERRVRRHARTDARRHLS
jgi:murein DD-endopeptidase MepM/ murein hydrolase activator NlpD